MTARRAATLRPECRPCFGTGYDLGIVGRGRPACRVCRGTGLEPDLTLRRAVEARPRPFWNPLALLRPPETILSRAVAIALLGGVAALIGAALL